MLYNSITFSKVLQLFCIAFGEIEISPLTVFILGALTVFTFLAVGVSSLKLVQSAIEEEGEE